MSNTGSDGDGVTKASADAFGATDQITDSVDQAIAAVPTYEVRVLAPANIPIKRRDGSITGFSIGLPEDLDDEALVAMMRAVGQYGDEYIESKAQPKHGLTLVRGNLPKAGA